RGDGRLAGSEVREPCASGFKGGAQCNVWKVPAKGGETRLTGLEERLGCADETAGSVDEADRGERMADFGRIPNQIRGPEIIHARSHERRRAPVRRGFGRDVERFEPRAGHRYSGSQPSKPASDNNGLRR